MGGTLGQTIDVCCCFLFTSNICIHNKNKARKQVCVYSDNWTSAEYRPRLSVRPIIPLIIGRPLILTSEASYILSNGFLWLYFKNGNILKDGRLWLISGSWGEAGRIEALRRHQFEFWSTLRACRFPYDQQMESFFFSVMLLVCIITENLCTQDFFVEVICTFQLREMFSICTFLLTIPPLYHS